MNTPALKLINQILALVLLTATCYADPKPLSKADATTILENMGYKQTKVAFVIQDAVPMAATPNGAMVTGLGRMNGKLEKIEKQFFYDNDIGWFYTEDRGERGNVSGIRIWSANGYSETKPEFEPPPPAPPVPHTPPGQAQVDDLERANKEIGEVYQKLMSALPPEKQKSLREAQRAWLKSRDPDADRIARDGDAVGGSAYRVDFSTAAAKLTTERTEVLRGYLANPNSIP